ncbi:MAG: hypothetical protein AB7Q69_15960 [Gemmatimonadales bacterium]
MFRSAAAPMLEDHLQPGRITGFPLGGPGDRLVREAGRSGSGRVILVWPDRWVQAGLSPRQMHHIRRLARRGCAVGLLSRRIPLLLGLADTILDPAGEPHSAGCIRSSRMLHLLVRGVTRARLMHVLRLDGDGVLLRPPEAMVSLRDRSAEDVLGRCRSAGVAVVRSRVYYWRLEQAPAPDGDIVPACACR